MTERQQSNRPHQSMRFNRLQGVLLCAALILMIVACGNQSPASTSQQLAKDQTLTLPLFQGNGITTLDPAYVNTEANHSVTDEIFGGLLRVNAHLDVVPYIASSMPTVSADGLTYTFHIRPDARFWNGDPVTAQDVIYSWSRTAAAQGTFATFFDPVVGYQQVAAGTSQALSGLTAVDQKTLTAHLSTPAGYWLEELAMWPANIVDPSAVERGGSSWWSNPATLVGAGPFRLTQYVPNYSAVFEPVKNWWGGSTGHLTQVRIEMGVSAVSAVAKYEAGGFDLVGAEGQVPHNADILQFDHNPAKKSQLHIFNIGQSNWLGFNFTGNNPFAPAPGLQPGQPTQGLGQDQGKLGREAFSLAINREQLVNVACAGGLTCTPGTGGYIASGLAGYLGNNTNSIAPSSGDAAKAKALYQQWDPTGSKVKGLALEYSSNAQSDVVAQNIQAQLQQSIGVHIQLNPVDSLTAREDLDHKKAALFLNGWFADYNSPQEWFDNVFGCTNARINGSNNAGYCDQSMDAAITQANQKPLTQALTEYKQAQQTMIQNAFGAELYYSKRPWLIQPYVRGAGFNGVADLPWTGISILQH